VIYLEYSDFVVERGLAPAILCSTSRKNSDIFQYLARAEKIYDIENGMLSEIKNRHGETRTYPISSEDELVLRLRAVVI
jgi:hypothetical protein